MEAELITLLAIVAASVLCPLLSKIVPKNLVPETVFLLIAGMVIGPHVLGWAQIGDAIELLSDLGLGLLFLLAGYEIDPKELTEKQGRNGFATWVVTFAIAVGVVVLNPEFKENPLGWLAVAIALTTTAFGTLVPILEERGIMNTPVGKSILAYGTWGELLPIIAIALVLSTRVTYMTVIVLVAFAAIAVIAAFIPKKIWQKENAFTKLIIDNAETNAQMTVRIVMLLLVGLVTVSAVFDLDIVLGAFAAGFVLRYIIPEGDEQLEHKLRGIGYGFFIPLFFIVSGTKIDATAVAQEPVLLLLFIVMLLLVRAVPIFVSLTISKATREMNTRNKATVALYCTTALPLIVAVTTVAVHAGAMSQARASLLVAAGGITVFLMPLLASITFHTIDAELGVAVKEIRRHPRKTIGILKAHRSLERKRNSQRKLHEANSTYFHAKGKRMDQLHPSNPSPTKSDSENNRS